MSRTGLISVTKFRFEDTAKGIDFDDSLGFGKEESRCRMVVIGQWYQHVFKLHAITCQIFDSFCHQNIYIHLR